jgi:peptidoglycan/LPS O-acetylase OafA/YrhL
LGLWVQRLPGIHGLRAIAAIGVVFFRVAYVRALLERTFIKLPPILDHVVPIFGFCVPLFFVISAFSLAYVHDKSVGEMIGSGRISLSEYFGSGRFFGP